MRGGRGRARGWQGVAARGGSKSAAAGAPGVTRAGEKEPPPPSPARSSSSPAPARTISSSALRYLSSASSLVSSQRLTKPKLAAAAISPLSLLRNTHIESAGVTSLSWPKPALTHALTYVLARLFLALSGCARRRRREEEEEGK